MPRSLQEILGQADDLAARFETHLPADDTLREANALGELRHAVLARASADRAIVDAVLHARSDGHSWAAIGAMLGTSGEAARQRFGPLVRA